MLATCKQEVGQSLDQFAQKLRSLAKECNFCTVSAEQYRDNALCDAFISGISSSTTRQRLLEQKKIDFQTAFETARSFELSQKQSESYHNPDIQPCNALPSSHDHNVSDSVKVSSAAYTTKCYFCGFSRHPRSKCPAREAICKSCGKTGHFQKVCLSSKQRSSTTNALLSASLTTQAPASLSQAIVSVKVEGIPLQALIDTGSSESYIASSVVHKHNWNILGTRKHIMMANKSLSSYTEGFCCLSILYKQSLYPRFKLSVMPNLCTDVLLGHDFLRLHNKLEIPFGGPKPSFSVCAMLAANVSPPSLFGNLSPDCKPIATKSRRHSTADEQFIKQEIERLLREGIIEPSISPWRAQVLVTSNDRHKKRLVVDYSQTINRYTQLDAYPLPRIDSMIEKIAKYDTFSTLDLQSAYHQIPLKAQDKPYTAFEACGQLYQFCRIPFGVTNGVACFQRIMDDLINKEKLKGTFIYVDNVTICGYDKADHDTNLSNFLKLANRYGLKFNESKSVFSCKTINLLGYEVSKGIIKSDPDRLKPLKELPPPTNLKLQQRAVGMFSYYSQWISHFSDKIHPLIHNTTFPITGVARQSFENLKEN